MSLERALIAAQEIVARAAEPGGTPAKRAIAELLFVLDDADLLRTMQDNGVTTRHPGAISAQV